MKENVRSRSIDLREARGDEASAQVGQDFDEVGLTAAKRSVLARSVRLSLIFGLFSFQCDRAFSKRCALS